MVFDDQAIRQDARRSRAAKRLAHDDDAILAERSRRYDGLKHAVLRAFGVGDVEHRRVYSHLPVSHLRIKRRAALDALAAHPGVVGVFPDTQERAFLGQSLPLVRQPQATAAGHAGAGTAVAVIDTGVDYTRPEFGSCTSPGVPASCRVAAAVEIAANDRALDASGHGTNVAAIVAAVAPGTKIIALDVFTRTGALLSDVLAGIDWVLQNRSTYNIVAVNMSLGSGKYTAPLSADPYYVPITNLRDAGVVPVAASGNDGYTDGLARPAAVAGAVSVGAVYDSNVGSYFGSCTDLSTSADRVTCFSNSASFLTLLAPGAYVSAGGHSFAGTSQAAPHVAGAAAALRSAFPGESVDQIVNRLQTVAAVVDPRNGINRPRLDVASAAGLSPGFPIGSYYPLADGNSWSYRRDGVSGYSEAVTGNQTVNGVSTKVKLSSPEGDQGFVTNDGAGIRLHGGYSPPYYVADCGGNVSETDTYSPPITFSPPNAYPGQAIVGTGVVTIVLSGCGTFNYTYASNTTIIGFETVIVPAGTFLAVRASLSLNVYSGATLVAAQSYVYWLAQGIGIVRSDRTSGTLQSEQLESTNLLRIAPDPFTLGSREDVAPNSLQVSGAVLVSGITSAAPISIAGGEYSINGGGWTSASGSVLNGQSVLVRKAASANNGTAVSAVLTVGGVNDVFTVSTASSAARVSHDLSGDGKSDIVWRNAGSGDNYLYPMSGLNILAGQGYLRNVPSPWTIVGVGDFDGDGKADLLWRNTVTGDTYLFLMNGMSVTGEGYGRNVPTDWAVAGVGDLNGDGKADIVWRNATTGDNYVYFMNGLAIATEGYLPNVPSPWTIATIGDFDGDGRSDLFWRNTSTGDTYFFLMNELTIVNQGYGRNVPTDWALIGAGDYNGDGKADLLWRNATSGDNYLYLLNGMGLVGEGYLRSVPAPWTIVGTGDYDGDGRADILWRNTSTGDDYLFLMNGLNVTGEGYLPSVPTNWAVVK